MLTVFKIVQLLVLLLCFAGAVGGKDERTNQTCMDLYKASGWLFLAAEMMPKIMEIIG